LAGVYDVCVVAELFQQPKSNDALNAACSEQDICLDSEGISIARFGS
jgi:hypothetical protein